MADHDDIPSTQPVSGDESSGVLGPYHLVRRIGEGGMGEVFLAEQREPIRRRVAVKLIKAGLDTREVLARFESERQALALMDHANVARIHDAGTTEAGRPYFVMEYVAGEPITAYCDRHRLSIEERLALFVPVCEAIHHAHQKGIIHRDVKPTNVLVTEVDGAPVAKVIDFGVAKAMSQPLTERTLFTAHGQLIGTPAYMSPEQAEMTGLNVDTTSDVYSLGVLLYELLAGAQPFDSGELRKAGLAEIHRIIREVDPPRPSTRADSMGDEATTLASHRHLQPRDWVRRLRGELDWITMRAMAKERARRYQSALELAADVRRYMSDEPVEAGPPSVRYRFGKFARRHRGLLASLSLIAVVLVSATVAVSLLYLRSERARADAVWNQYVAAMQLAGTAFDARSAPRLSTALERCPEEHRGWAWDWLHDQLDQSEGVMWTSPAKVASADLAQDAGLLALGRVDGMVTLLDLDRWQVVDSLRADESLVRRLALSPDGRFLATEGISSDSIRVHDLQRREVRVELEPPEEWTCGARVIFSSNSDGLLLFGDGLRSLPLDGGPARTLAPDANLPRDAARWYRGSCLSAAAHRPGTNSVVLARYDGTLLELDAATQELRALPFKSDVEFFVDEVVAGPAILVTSATRSTMPAGLDPWPRLPEDKRWMHRISRFVPGDIDKERRYELDARAWGLGAPAGAEWAAYGRPGGALVVHDLLIDQPIGSFLAHQTDLLELFVLDDGNTIVSVDHHGSVRRWSASNLRNQALPIPGSGRVLAVAVDPSGTRTLVAGIQEATELSRAGREAEPTPGFSAPDHPLPLDVAWHPDGHFLVAAATDRLPFGGHSRHGRSRAVYVLGHGQPLMATDDRPVRREPGQAAFSHDARLLAWGFNRGPTAEMSIDRDPTMEGIETSPSSEAIEVWDLDQGAPLRGYAQAAETITALAWSTDDRFLSFADEEFAVRVMRVDDGEVLHTLAGHRGMVRALATDASGRYLASASQDSTARLWDLSTGEVRAVLEGHTGPLRDVIFAPDGGRVVTIASDETVRVWDVTTGDQVTSIHEEGANGIAMRLAPHPDGRRLLLASPMGLKVLGAGR